MWVDTKVRLPVIGVPVLARLRGVTTGKVVEATLVHVNEEDRTWRTADDGSEIDFNWDVVEWNE